MRRTWNSWTYYGDGDSGRTDSPQGEKESVCQESWKEHGEKDGAPAEGALEGAFKQSMEQSLAKALERAMDLSDVRNERVERVKRAIQAGKYKVPAKELAQKLIRNMMGDY